jgi:hypothetical protein
MRCAAIAKYGWGGWVETRCDGDMRDVGIDGTWTYLESYNSPTWEMIAAHLTLTKGTSKVEAQQRDTGFKSFIQALLCDTVSSPRLYGVRGPGGTIGKHTYILIAPVLYI